MDVVHETGCLVIRNVVPEQQALDWEEGLRQYAKRHPKVLGFPSHNPQTYSLYWTPSQVQIRSHPKVMKAMDAVSRLWHITRDDSLFDLSSQVVYADRYRIRRPGFGTSQVTPAGSDADGSRL